MAKLILASVLCIFLLVKGTEAQAPGVACGSSGECDNGATCETPTCKANVGASCANNLPCVATAACDPEDTTCKTKVNEGETCTPASDNKICNPDATATLTCDTTCKVIHGQTCTSSTACIAEATCTGTPLQCTCTGEFTASSDSTECVANLAVGETCSDGSTCLTTATCETVGDAKTCKQKIEQACTVATECVSGAECPTEGTNKNKCTCKEGSTASQDKTKCGAMGIAASMLLVVATFVTSRFL